MSKTRNLITAGALMVLTGLSQLSFGQIRYEAALDASAKKLWSQQGSKIKCSLTGDIPEYGYVEFQSLSGDGSSPQAWDLRKLDHALYRNAS